MLRTIAINLAVLAVLALAALAGTEIWLRLTVPASSSESIFEYTLATPRYKVMRPDARIVAWGEELRTNDLGFRDDAPSIAPKQPGELRVIVLGDSMTVSAGVDFGAIYTSLLEKRLRSARPGLRVINLAVGGYNLEQYALVLQEVGLALHPDFILIGLCADNDFAVDTYDSNRRVALGQEPPPALAWPASLYVYRAYLRKVVARIDRMLDGGRRPEEAASDHGWERNSAALRRIMALARAHRLPVAAVVLPQAWHFERQRPMFVRVAAACREQHLPCLDLLERFIERGIPASSLGLNPLDLHPNEKYNALVAEELAPYVERLINARSDALHL